MGATTRAFVVTLVVFLALAFAAFTWQDAHQAPPAESVGSSEAAANESGMETPNETGIANATNAGGDATAYQGEGLQGS